MSDSLVPVFDGHNDVLLRLFKDARAEPERRFLDGLEGGHLDLPRIRRGGLAGGFFAMFVPSRGQDLGGLVQGGPTDAPMPAAPDLADAQAATAAMTSILLRIEALSAGAVRICRTVDEIRAAIAAGSLATVLHIEGAEALDPDFRMLDVLEAAGLRSIGPVWSRPNIFGHGVPFRYPSSPDTGPGLTELGKELVRQCNRRHLVIDLSHINEKGFWDVARLSTAPLVATHSNVHAVCAASRNLTRLQLEAIRASGGVVGLNFATSFLRPDGSASPDTPIDDLLRHLDALLEALGESGVALGSDFDGAQIPRAIGDVAGLPRLVDAMREHGYGEALVRRIACDNWLSLLERTWGM